jgi:hypothetical protein
MTLDEFKKEGRASLGAKTHDDLSYQIRVKAPQIQEQMLVAGWGHAPASAMLYEIGASGCQNHSYSGIATIGSGSRIAMSYLLTLGQGRDCTLAETVFNVAMAKFASEKSEGLDVGPRTAIHVSRKAAKGEGLPCTEPLLEEEILSLRQIWQEEVKPRITKQGRLTANRVAQRIAGEITAADVARSLQAKS